MDNMKKKNKIGKFVLIALVFVAVSIYFLSNFHVFSGIFFSVDWLPAFVSMLLYGAIAGVPAVLLRMKFKAYSRKWIALAASAVCILCFAVIAVVSETELAGKEWVCDLAQNALISSAPVLYCVAFFGNGRDPWVAVLPSIIYFFAFFARWALVYGLAAVFGVLRYFDLNFIFFENPDPLVLGSVMTVTLMSAVFFAWALFCIFASNMAHRYVSRKKNKK